MTPLLPHINEYTEDSMSPEKETMDHGAQKNGNQTNPLKREKSSDPIQCEEGPGLVAYLLTLGSLLLVAASLPLSLFFVVKVVQEYERAVIFRLGRLLTGGARGPGVFFIIPCVDTYEKIDMRSQTFEIPPQEILTKDSVTVFVNAIMYYKVANAIHAVANVDDYGGSSRLLAATTLRNVLGTLNLGDILSQRESIARDMRESLDVATEPWGVKVERVEVKDVRVPEQLQRAMAAEAEAAREARAKVIGAEGEHKASRALRQAAEVIMDSPAALQLRYLQTLNSISAENNSTIIFPVPIDIMASFMQANKSNQQQQQQQFQQFQYFQQQQSFQNVQQQKISEKEQHLPNVHSFPMKKTPNKCQDDPSSARDKERKSQRFIRTATIDMKSMDDLEHIDFDIPEDIDVDISEVDLPEIDLDRPDIDLKIPEDESKMSVV